MDAWILHYFITMCCNSSKVVMLQHKLERHDSSKALFLLQISKGITNCHYSRVFPLLEKEDSELLNNLSFSFSFMHIIGFFHAEEKKYMPFVYPQENLEQDCFLTLRVNLAIPFPISLDSSLYLLSAIQACAETMSFIKLHLCVLDLPLTCSCQESR